MNDEEIKAIEKLKETAKQCHNSKECWENESCCDCYVEVEDIFAIETVLNLIEKQKAEIEKKDEIIDLMASYMWKYDCCRYEIIKKGECKNLCLEKDCKEQCIKQYFENKVKEKQC